MTELAKKPPYPGRLVDDEVAALNLPLTTARAAATLGVTPQLLYRLAYEERAAGADRDIRLKPDVVENGEHWVRMETGHETTQLRLRNTALEIARSLDASGRHKK